jgi:hypothetical protein
MDDSSARHGWSSNLPVFRSTAPPLIYDSLRALVHDASDEQLRAWRDSIPPLQREASEILDIDPTSAEYSAILEYELPLESRRPDVLVLAKGAVIVLELKGKESPSQADLDQVSAYARDLRCYHASCANRQVLPVVVPMRANGYLGQIQGVHIAGPDAIDRLILELQSAPEAPPLSIGEFLSSSAYRPLPTLVQAARELFHSHTIRRIHQACASTDPAVHQIADIVHEAARTRSRRLILLTGVPGAGKTLVGLRTVHAEYLDTLAVSRPGGLGTVPAVFLSGNGPLVEVLQYELRSAGGGGKAFVRGVKEYVKYYSSKRHRIPPEHVLVFDEAQRAFDAEQVRKKHAGTVGFEECKSEPEHFIDFAERIPEWCVVIGLIGSGQEIHVGEEAGLGQWRTAIERSQIPSEWQVHGPQGVADIFAGSSITFHPSQSLNLDSEIRFHLASDLHRYVQMLLTGAEAEANRMVARKLSAQCYHLHATRSLEVAKNYLRERYFENRAARFGVVASSKDKDLVGFGVANDFQSTKRIKFGPWYGDDESTAGGHSCRHLRAAVTEFGAQGLELDAALLAWGTDLVRLHGQWSNHRARGYRRGAHVKDPFQLRLNAYRVLLTRGRDATVVFVPQLSELDETWEYLVASGFGELAD